RPAPERSPPAAHRHRAATPSRPRQSQSPAPARSRFPPPQSSATNHRPPHRRKDRRHLRRDRSAGGARLFQRALAQAQPAPARRAALRRSLNNYATKADGSRHKLGTLACACCRSYTPQPLLRAVPGHALRIIPGAARLTRTHRGGRVRAKGLFPRNADSVVVFLLFEHLTTSATFFRRKV